MASIPHGGVLVNRVVSGEAREEILARAAGLPVVYLGPVEKADLEMLAVGAMSPLEGFLREEDYRRVVAEMRLGSGVVWSLPVTLSVGAKEAGRLPGTGNQVALVDGAGHILGIMDLEDVYRRDLGEEAQQVYKTADPAHPGVARLLACGGEYCLGGKISLLNFPERHFPEEHLSPLETRAVFAARGWRRVVGFQTRNPVHRAHEYIQKCALEITDGLLLHPLVGETKEDDLSAAVRMRSYRVLLGGYYPKDRVLLGVFPAAMRYAGPREAIFHALARKNYGCTHFIVGRDHAGVGNYYGPIEAQEIFDQFSPAEIGIEIMRFGHAFYCRRCQGMVSDKTCPHSDKEHIKLSGTLVRQLLRAGKVPPPEFSRPEVARLLADGIREEETTAEREMAVGENEGGK